MSEADDRVPPEGSLPAGSSPEGGMARAAAPGRPPLPPDQALARLADLEVAHEELRVAEAQVRVQQEQIEQLLGRHEAERRWRSHLSSAVPVPMGMTDGYGKLVDANPALAGYLQVPLHRLRNKPLAVLLEPGDVPAFRAAVAGLAAGHAVEQRLRVAWRARRDAAGGSELFGFVETPSGERAQARVQWVLVEQAPGEPSPSPADEPRRCGRPPSTRSAWPRRSPSSPPCPSGTATGSGCSGGWPRWCAAPCRRRTR